MNPNPRDIEVCARFVKPHTGEIKGGAWPDLLGEIANMGKVCCGESIMLIS